MTELLLTGSEGFVGRHLRPALAEAGYWLHLAGRADGDVSDKATWAGFPDAEVVIHLAAQTSVQQSWDNPLPTLRSNVLGTAAALEYCHERGSRFILLSSYLYGDPERLPIAEDATVKMTNPYALSKKLAEDLCSFYAMRHEVPITILRPFNIYGPGQSASFLIPTIVRQAQHDREIRVQDLAPRRDYVYVRDVVDAIAAAVARPEADGIFNIGSGRSYSVAELIDLVQSIWGTNLPVFSDDRRRRGEVMDTVADVSRAKKLLGWSPQTSLAEGLREMYACDETV